MSPLMFTAYKNNPETCYACIHSIRQCTVTLHLTTDIFSFVLTIFQNCRLCFIYQTSNIFHAIFFYIANTYDNEIDNDAHIHTITH